MWSKRCFQPVNNNSSTCYWSKGKIKPYNPINHVHCVFRRLEKNTKTKQYNLTKKKHVVHIYCKSDEIEQLKV